MLFSGPRGSVRQAKYGDLDLKTPSIFKDLKMLYFHDHDRIYLLCLIELFFNRELNI